MPAWFPMGKPIGTPGSCVPPHTQSVLRFGAGLHSPLPCWYVPSTFGAWFWILSSVQSLHKKEPLSRNSFQLRYIKDFSTGGWKHPTWWRTRFLDLVNALIPEEMRWTCLAGWVSCSLLSLGIPWEAAHLVWEDWFPTWTGASCGPGKQECLHSSARISKAGLAAC